jgi:hypothetical protein
MAGAHGPDGTGQLAQRVQRFCFRVVRHVVETYPALVSVDSGQALNEWRCRGGRFFYCRTSRNVVRIHGVASVKEGRACTPP